MLIVCTVRSLDGADLTTVCDQTMYVGLKSARQTAFGWPPQRTGNPITSARGMREGEMFSLCMLMEDGRLRGDDGDDGDDVLIVYA